MNGVLLDTQAVVHALNEEKRFSDETARIIADGRNLYLSAVSIAEIAIKVQIGKLKIPNNFFERLKGSRVIRLPLTWDHASRLRSLPLLHRAPFDRLLIAQALVENLILVTNDRAIRLYPVETMF
jgi:PIN domain nuclease of toxin-antitoxin system